VAAHFEEVLCDNMDLLLHNGDHLLLGEHNEEEGVMGEDLFYSVVVEVDHEEAHIQDLCHNAEKASSDDANVRDAPDIHDVQEVKGYDDLYEMVDIDGSPYGVVFYQMIHLS